MLHTARSRHKDISVGQALRLAYLSYNVLSEAVHSHIQPVAHNVLQCLSYLWIVVIEVGLLLCVEMQIELPSLLVVLPGGAGEGGLPVIRCFFAVFALSLAPDIKIGIGLLALNALFKPFVLVGGMIYYKVHNDLKPHRMRPVKHLLKLLESAVFGIDIAIIRYIVAVIRLRRYVQWRKPYRVNAYALYIIELAEHALKVADAVIIAVAERTGPNLIYSHFFKPFSFFHKLPPNAANTDVTIPRAVRNSHGAPDV